MHRRNTLSDEDLLAIAYAGFLLYGLVLLLSWPPLQGFIEKAFGAVI
ncbi:MAG: hypothetical protein Q7T16_00195 [Candidatus Burarchaeum sp.]|nr:hypothetical protein [Candidatus Burarchaeum sp.]MDO8339059.1 hypothetical protein [Candidatus Burarchaeum sp.]